jgi:hypothetical protein
VAVGADLALGDELVERPDGLLDRRLGVGRVQLVELDAVGLQPSQRRLDGVADVRAGALGTPRLRALDGEPGVAPLRREHDLVARGAAGLREGDAHEGLGGRGRVAVDVGGVEERDAVIDRGVDDRVGARLVLRHGAPAAEVVAAEADG